MRLFIAVQLNRFCRSSACPSTSGNAASDPELSVCSPALTSFTISNGAGAAGGTAGAVGTGWTSFAGRRPALHICAAWCGGRAAAASGCYWYDSLLLRAGRPNPAAASYAVYGVLCNFPSCLPVQCASTPRLPRNVNTRNFSPGGYPRDYMLPGHLLPPGHPGGPHLHMFDPIDDGEDDEDDYDEDDDEDEMMEWAEVRVQVA